MIALNLQSVNTNDAREMNSRDIMIGPNVQTNFAINRFILC